ncbi:MAG: RnfABCDGE type electron transport complex subunit D [Desulfobulbaceae bacterium]|nr:RnfABCDGE type electron transport complex subunit D [Desulfobulbaceae bacterium]
MVSQKRYSIPQPWLLKQKMMFEVCYALLPLVAASVYFFGWRAFVQCVVVLFFGLATEALFVFKDGKPVTSAVFVTCLIFALSLPPTLPFWMAAVGIVVAVSLGKMAFGGFGRNIFNPAMVGRCFLYITFPNSMNSIWAQPSQGWVGGGAFWAPTPDAITSATPLMQFKEGISTPFFDMLWGNTPGSLGETSGILIILGAAYLIYKKAAPWRIALSCLIGGVLVCSILNLFSLSGSSLPLATIFSGSFLFGTAFVATEPITGAKTKEGQWIYGFMIGGLTIVLRRFSNFPEGLMFAVLMMNALVPLLDNSIRQVQKWRQSLS